MSHFGIEKSTENKSVSVYYSAVHDIASGHPPTPYFAPIILKREY
jgi:hypothetical protein